VSGILDSHLLWYLNRGTGVVLVAVLTLSAVLGMVSASGRAGRRWPRFAVQTLHRNVSLVACALLVAHAVTPVLDTYVNNYAPIAWPDALVPFVSEYKPLGLGLGTLALDLLLVVVATSAVRVRLGRRAWFRVHLLSYAAWALGLVHGFLIGSDSRTVWGLGVTVAAVVAVAGAAVVRLLPAPPAGASAPVPAQAPLPSAEPGAAPAAGGRRAAGRRSADAHEPRDREPGRRASGRRASGRRSAA
jgi:hypothetical protein